MTPETTRNVHKILRAQQRVITRRQGAEAGLPPHFMRHRLCSGRWQRPYRGVYVTVSGALPREAQLRAALLRAGPGAVFTHETAAEIHGLLASPSHVIHITVPERRNPARYGKIPGVRIYRSDIIVDDSRVSGKTLPCTTVEDTVIDLVNRSKNFDAAYEWVCKALGKWRTTPDRLLAAMKARKRVRFRRDIEIVLQVARGAMSWLERRYVTGVEAPHGIQAAARQERVRQETGNTYMDNVYRLYKTCVELDGAVAHPEDEQWKDKKRDRWNLVHQQTVTLRFGVPDLRTDDDLCRTAADVAKVLSDRGPAVGHPCDRPGCAVPDSAVARLIPGALNIQWHKRE